MSWWSPSWLPTLPSIDFSLPSGIQRRFVSFALRRSLGHLLKPGQLEAQQVDSQIGSGYVQVKDLELDNDAINALIAGLPVRLHEGSLGRVTARVPWPNPLTSTIGLSLESLHLVFELSPTLSESVPALTHNLAESVASVAESFVHDELSPTEEATLRHSFYPDMTASSQSLGPELPGGLDPFVGDDESSHGEGEMPEVSIFATLVQRLLARFEFEATDIRITLVHPEHASFTLKIPEMRYDFPTNKSSSPRGNTGTGPEDSERCITISGVTLTTRSLLPLSPQVMTPIQPSSLVSEKPMSPATSHAADPVSPGASISPSSPRSDSSELDEDTQMLMSQSLAFLPPRPVSPASEAASSMYQSAISSPVARFAQPEALEPEAGTSRTPSPPSDTQSTSPSAPTSPPPRRIVTDVTEDEEDTIFSLTSEPAIIRFMLPFSASRNVEETPHPAASDAQHQEHLEDNTNCSPAQPLVLNISLGVPACALRAWHIRSMMDVAQVWRLHSPSPDIATVDGNASHPSIPNQSALQVNLNIRGSTLILLPDAEQTLSARRALAEFFLKPLLPPKLPHGYVRLLLDDISMGLTIRTTITRAQSHNSSSTSRAPDSSRSITTSTSLTLTLHDVSVFSFLSTHDLSRPEPSSTHIASPILITDPHLSSQYSLSRIDNTVFCTDQDKQQLPQFDIIDWTSPRFHNDTAKLSFWRTRPTRHIPVSPPSHTPQLTHHLPLTSSTYGSPRTKSSDLPRSMPSASTRPLAGSPRFPGFSNLSQSSTSPIGVDPPAEQLARPSPAVVVKAKFVSEYRHENREPSTVDVQLAPLHLFADLDLLLDKDGQTASSEVMAFLDKLASSDSDALRPGFADQGDSDVGEDEIGLPTTRPATPRAHRPYHTPDRERDRERERRRLERLILEDLDLTYDYRDGEKERQAPRSTQGPSTTPRRRRRKTRSRASSDTTTTVRFAAIRVEIRVPPPPSRAPRSGALILDIHDLWVSSGGGSTKKEEPHARFRQVDDPAFPEAYDALSTEDDAGTPLFSAGWRRITLAHSLIGEDKAHAFVCLCTDSLGRSTDKDKQLRPAVLPPRSDSGSSPILRVIRSTPATSRSGLRSSPLVVALDLPSVHVELSKPILDGLQIWADDVAQLIERVARAASSSTNSAPSSSAQTSLIGSRYFARGSGSSVATSENTINPNMQASSEVVVKLGIQEALLRLLVPRKTDTSTATRPSHIAASDIDLLLELRPEGKDETVVTLGVSRLNIQDVDGTHSPTTLLYMTNANDLGSATQSAVKVRFVSLTVPETTSKESRVKVTLCGLTCNVPPDFEWLKDIAAFAKAPPGVFESVVPSERTRVSIKTVDTSILITAARHAGALVAHFKEFDFATDVIGDSLETALNCSIASLSLYFLDDLKTVPEESSMDKQHKRDSSNTSVWKSMGYALLAELSGAHVGVVRDQTGTPPTTTVSITEGDLRLHLCADTMSAIAAFFSGVGPAPDPTDPKSPKRKRRAEPADLSTSSRTSSSYLLSSLDEHAFTTLPEVGAAPDMIGDDLPRNLEYLDDYGAAAGLKELSDDELDAFDDYEPSPISESDNVNVISRFGGETIKMLGGDKLNIIEDYFENMTPEPADGSAGLGESALNVKVQGFNATLFLYDGYDWARTRRTIEEGRREMKRKLAKIKQLVASGQTPDPSVEETSALLFNSVYVGLEQGIEEMEPAALIAAIDEELNDDEAASHSSWQSLRPQQMSSPGKTASALPATGPRKNLTRSRAPSIEFRFSGLCVDMKHFKEEVPLVSRLLVTIQDVDILDHIKTSTWRKFLTALREDSRGNIREAGSDMVRVELRSVHPVPDHPSEEARLRAKILPLRLHVDQDALDFLKKFFSFKDPDSAPAPSSESDSDEIYFQQAEVFPVDIKLDYKPRRVDYRALRDGRTIELMNFFHFDGAEMTLRHITLNGITGWARMFDLLNDLWTPDVKATQLVDVISGVSPIRSVVNVGSGVADLVLLPIAQYKKDGRVYRGLQKGTKAFVKSTAMEAIRLGARLATGTQVILEQAETVLGGQFDQAITAEAVPVGGELGELAGTDEDGGDLISRYAEQPMNAKEGVQSAYKSLRRNFSSAAQTILAVPMEVYERSGNEGPVRAVVRAVPIAVLKPMIGASEAVSKTLMGIHNQLDPGVRHENEAKYKQR